MAEPVIPRSAPAKGANKRPTLTKGGLGGVPVYAGLEEQFVVDPIQGPLGTTLVAYDHCHPKASPLYSRAIDPEAIRWTI